MCIACERFSAGQMQYDKATRGLGLLVLLRIEMCLARSCLMNIRVNQYGNILDIRIQNNIFNQVIPWTKSYQ